MLPNKKCTIQVNYILNVIYKTLKNFSIVQLIRNRLIRRRTCSIRRLDPTAHMF